VGVEQVRMKSCRGAGTTLATNLCELPLNLLPAVYQRKDAHGQTIFTNE